MKILSSRFRQLGECFYHHEKISPLKNIRWVNHNAILSQELGLDSQRVLAALPYFNGEKHWKQADYLSMVYSGHQFGVYVPRLGDGRAMVLGDIEDKTQQYWQLQLKGSGQTKYSRQGDGRAVLRSSIREYLASEALYHLGIPTTRALGLMASDEVVYRERPETGALLLRATPSLVRFGSFEYFFYTEQYDCLKQLADYVIEYHYPACQQEEHPYAELLSNIVKRTARMIALWQAYGFSHGVMNTDNMSIIGETFDYGPFAFLDDYIPGFAGNHSDTYGRYAFNQQVDIALWNLNALAHALSPLISHDEIVVALKLYEKEFRDVYLAKMAERFGLLELNREAQELMLAGLDVLAELQLDYHRFFRLLSHAVYADNFSHIAGELKGEEAALWLAAYQRLVKTQDRSLIQSGQKMLAVNPKYILRTYLLDIVIAKAEQGDFTEINHLMNCLSQPFAEQPEYEHYADAVPEWGKKIVLSCSS